MSPRVLAPLALALALASGGCNWIRDPGGNAEAQDAPEQAPVPDTVEGFLAELAPLPNGAKGIQIDYEVSGPALSGELHTTLGPGGQRRDRWQLRSTAGDEFLTIAGTSVVSTTQLWIGSDGEPGELRPNALVELGKAYLARDAEERAKIIASIRSWHETLAAQRERNSGELDTVAGTSCLRTRIAAQNVCMWEQANVMLAYEGAAFSIKASKIDDQIELKADSFELPPLAVRAEKVEATGAQDFEGILDELAAGSHAKVAVLLYANLGMPAMQMPEAKAEPPSAN